MADQLNQKLKESTPPPTTKDSIAEKKSSPITPLAKRFKAASISPPASSSTQAESLQDADTNELETEPLPADAEDDNDSAFGTDVSSDTTSISSSIYAGYVENGRRYQNVREGEYWGPSDEKQFENMEAAHIVHMILDHNRENPLFHAPVERPQNILDIGTGTGVWARQVADKFPSSVVTGIDLSPPPEDWVPPNCKFEIDDALKTWFFKQKFDLIHMRWLMGAFSPRQWSHTIYKQAYDNLLPGGWIEQIEPTVYFASDDSTLPADSTMAQWGPMFLRIGENIGRPLDTVDTMKASIEAAGFVNVKEKVYKVPMGEWAKNKTLKEAGRFSKISGLAGMEGYAMFLLTKFGEPTPWSVEEVQVLLAKMRADINNKDIHAYQIFRRVWAQKPLDAQKASSKSETADAA